MRHSKIIYYPSLSIKGNAKKNGVSIAAIRYYIRANNIDRRAEEKYRIITKCRRYYTRHPHTSKSKLAAETNFSLSTICKYWDYITSDKPFVSFDRNKAKLRQGVIDTPIKVDANGYALWSDVLKEVPSILQLSEQEDVSALSAFFQERPEMPMLFIGSGGERGIFAAFLYGLKYGIGRAITPYQLPSISDDALRRSRIFLLSKGGRNEDIEYAADRVAKVNPDNSACLTFNTGPDNLMLNAIKGTSVRVFAFPHLHFSSGFTSVRTKYFKLGLFYRAFGGSQSIMSKIKIDLSPASCFIFKLNKDGVDIPSFKQIHHYLVLFGGYSEPVAADFESVMAETGIASAQVSDYRNYCHGRFIFASNHTKNNKEPRQHSDAAMILLITPREKNIAVSVMNKAIPAQMPVVIVETEHNSPLATIDLMIKTNVLIGVIGEKAFGINPYSPQNYSSEIDKRVPKNGVKFKSDFKKWGNLSIE